MEGGCLSYGDRVQCVNWIIAGKYILPKDEEGFGVGALQMQYLSEERLRVYLVLIPSFPHGQGQDMFYRKLSTTSH